MGNNKPNPDSDYLSKYLVDFNKRELDKFFHPEKYPKVVLSVAALGVIAFFFVAWMFPLKDQLFNSQFQKESSFASDEKETENLTISGPQSAKKGDDITLLITARTDQKLIKTLQLDISYPSEHLILLSGKPLGAMNNQAELGAYAQNLVGFKLQFSPPLHTNGAQQELVALTFKAKMSGQVDITFAESTSLYDVNNMPLNIWKNNYSLVITD